MKKILLVDDEVAILISFQELLQSPTVRVDTAETFEQAEKLLKEEQYDVAIADLRLTGVLGEEGLEIINYIRDHNPGTKTMLITGYGNPKIMAKAYDLGVAFYFEKPVTISTLKEALESLGIR